MENVVRAQEVNLKQLKIASHRTRSPTITTAEIIPQNQVSTDLNVVRLEEFVVNKPVKKGWILPLFVIMGIGLNMPYAALNGAIVYFSDMFGNAYYLDFLAAFNIPAIPILTAQLLLDESIDKRFGSRITFSFRLILTFMIMAVCTFAIPLMVHSFLYIIVLISIIGIANGIAFGSMFQLGAIFSSKGTACIFVGLGLGNLFTTVTLLLLKFDNSASDHMNVVTLFFQIHAGMVVLGVLAIIVVMLTKPIGEVLAEKDRVSRQLDSSDYEPLLAVNEEEEEREEREERKEIKSSNEDVDKIIYESDDEEDLKAKRKKRAAAKKSNSWKINLLVLKSTWKSQLSMFLTYFTGVTILSFIAYLPQVDNWKMGMFTLMALYINIYGDFAGKNLTLFPSPIKSDLTLLIVSVIRSLYLIYFFLYITVDGMPGNDYIILGTMAIVATLGGYLTNLMFTIAPTTAPAQYKQQVASMVTLVLHLAVYSAIGISFLLTAYVHFRT